MGRLGIGRRQDSGRLADGTAIAGGERAPETLEVPGRIPATLAGARHPLVAILLLMSFFTVLSGKPVDGFLLFSVASALSWDAGVHTRRAAELRQRQARAAAGLDSASMLADPPVLAAELADDAEQQPVWQVAARRPSVRLILLGAACAIIYAAIVGSFTRYSWPATFGIVAVGSVVVVTGWGGPIRRRSVPGKLSWQGVLTWSTLLVTCGLWELSALLMQPNFATSSYDHPTISTLTDPLLATPAGRGVALLAWLGLGVFLVLR